MTPIEKLQTILNLAFAEIEEVKREAGDLRLRADDRLADACVAARRIGLPPGVDLCPERDGVDALVWCADRWRDAAQRPPEDEEAGWKMRYLEAVRQRDTARSGMEDVQRIVDRVSRLAAEFQSMGLPQGVEWYDGSDSIERITRFALAWRERAVKP